MKNLLICLFLLSVLMSCQQPEKSEHASTTESSLPDSKPTTPSPADPEVANILTKNGLFKENMDSEQLNDAGLELYKKGLLKDAETIFRKAIELKPDYGYANYNLACVLALLFPLAKENSSSFYPYEVFHYLFKAIQLNKSIREKAKNDNDFLSVKDYMEYKVLTDSEYARALEKTVLFEHVSSLEGDSSISFKDDEGNTYTFNTPRSASLLSGLHLYTVSQNSENGPRVGRPILIKWGTAIKFHLNIISNTRKTPICICCS